MANILTHWGLCVTDMDRSVRFYTNTFGFTFDRELRMTSDQIDGLLKIEPKSDIHAVYLMLAGQTLELMHFTGTKETARGRAFNHTGLTHFSIAVDDVPLTLARCVESGGSIASDIGFAAAVRDPNGQLVEILPMSFHDEVEAGRRARA